MSPARQKPIPPDRGPAGEFAQALRDARDAAGISTDSELAARAACSKSTISKALSGTRLPTPTIVKALATAFGDDPDGWLRRLEQAQAAREAPVTPEPDTEVDDNATTNTGLRKALDAVPVPILYVLAVSVGSAALMGFLALMGSVLGLNDPGALEWAKGTPVSNQEKSGSHLGRVHESWVWQNIGPHATVNTTFATHDEVDLTSLGGQLALGRGCAATITWTIKADGTTVATGTLESSTAKPLHVLLQGYTKTVDFTATRQDDLACTTSLTWTDDIQVQD